MRTLFVFLRSTLFNILFYGSTAFLCIIFIPLLFLPKRFGMISVQTFVKVVHFLEKYIIGLTYELKGLENVPRDVPYIVAVKHQSAYETIKLNVLFDKPAVILKQELLNIPLWGRFLKIIEPIAIDRSRGKKAMQQIIEGAEEVRRQGRSIVIFPQGTRVHTWQTPQDKPYKIGVARMHEATKMPIVPMALNTGVFWPRNSWMKWPGKVTFEFLPAIKDDLGIYEVMKDLEIRLEQASNELEEKARQTYKIPSKVENKSKSKQTNSDLI